MPVRDEGRHIVVFAARDGRGRGAGEEGGQREEVAGAGWAVRYEGEDLGDQALLDGGFLLLLTFLAWRGRKTYELCVEFCEARLPGIIEDQHGVDHVCNVERTRGARLEAGVVGCGSRFDARRGLGEG